MAVTIQIFYDGMVDALETWQSSDDIKVAVLDATNNIARGDAAPELADYTQITDAAGYVTKSVGTWGNFITRSTNVINFGGTDPVWADGDSTDTDARYLLYYNDTQSGDPCFGWVDMGANFDMGGGAGLSGAQGTNFFTVTIPAS